VLLSLAAGPLRRRLSFSRAALGALVADGVLTLALAGVHWSCLGSRGRRNTACC